MIDTKVKAVLRVLAQTALELAEICDRDIPSFAGTWHSIAKNAQVLEQGDSIEPDDAHSLLEVISSLYELSSGGFY